MLNQTNIFTQQNEFNKLLKINNINININDTTTTTTTNNSVNSSNDINYTQNIYNISKLYYKYLSSVNTKILNTNIIKVDEIDINEINNFNECYEYASIIYNKIKKDWYWISNGTKMKQFILKSNLNDPSINNYYNNYLLLKTIANLYGFKLWYTNTNLKQKQKQNYN